MRPSRSPRPPADCLPDLPDGDTGRGIRQKGRGWTLTRNGASTAPLPSCIARPDPSVSNRSSPPKIRKCPRIGGDGLGGRYSMEIIHVLSESDPTHQTLLSSRSFVSVSNRIRIRRRNVPRSRTVELRERAVTRLAAISCRRISARRQRPPAPQRPSQTGHQEATRQWRRESGEQLHTFLSPWW